MDPVLFAKDLTRKPETMRALAQVLSNTNPWQDLPPAERYILLGMGSSKYAASVAAARLAAAGINAIDELASSDLLPAVTPGTVVIAVSAGGGSRETKAAVEHYLGTCPVVLLTNKPESELARRVDLVVDMHAEVEEGGVASRSFQHTVAMLLALEVHLGASSIDVPALVHASADASEYLLGNWREWLGELTEHLVGPDGIHTVAPARRFSSAAQSALMLREGPRSVAVACETGDWSHVDVYLTKTTDYRMLLFAGSRWEDELMNWVTERGSTVVAVGGEVPGAVMTIRYPGDDNDDVALLTEVLIGELLASDQWLRQQS
jgi:fructoselysine-6-P-deglycase FrlB-like protein